MKDWIKRSFLFPTVFSLVAGSFASCGTASDQPTAPRELNWACYNDAEDEAFLPKDIFSQELFVSGIVPGQTGSLYFDIADSTDTGAFVIKGEYGKCYEVKIPAGPSRVCAARVVHDPREIPAGAQLRFTEDAILYDKDGVTDAVSFMYTCRARQEYLVVYTGSADPVYIGERTMLAEKDTQDNWFIPKAVGSIDGDCTFGNVAWTSDEVINNLYEPLREKYPEYITRTVIGKDQSGMYDMYGYVFEPEDYEVTMFLTGGMHANEEVGFFALAKIMQLVSDATVEDELLYTLRHKVRFVVVPIINVWGVSRNVNVRQNSMEVDLNRDFGNLSQQESKNVMAWFEQYAQDAVIAMDFHTAKTEGIALWFNFINYTPNSVANYKTTNHMYHRYTQMGLSNDKSGISHIPGSYAKSDKYIEGRIWNQYGVPTITVEYVVNSTFPTKYSAECMTLAVETYSNFIIQNALFYLQEGAQS